MSNFQYTFLIVLNSVYFASLGMTIVYNLEKSYFIRLFVAIIIVALNLLLSYAITKMIML